MKNLLPLQYLIQWGLIFLVSGIANELLSQDIALPDKIQFQTIVVPGGKDANRVGRMHQDKMGLLWLPTQGGLFRYDGINFKQYLLENKDSKGKKGKLN